MLQAMNTIIKFLKLQVILIIMPVKLNLYYY